MRMWTCLPDWTVTLRAPCPRCCLENDVPARAWSVAGLKQSLWYKRRGPAPEKDAIVPLDAFRQLRSMLQLVWATAHRELRTRLPFQAARCSHLCYHNQRIE